MAEDGEDVIAGVSIPKLRAVAFRSGEWWVAQVLEYYLATQAKSLEALAAEVDRILRVQIHVSEQCGVEPFEGYQVAPLRFWEMFESGAAMATPYSTEIRTWESASASGRIPGAGLGPYGREDYLRFPEGTRRELLYGWLLRRPRADAVHQIVVSGLARKLGEFAEGRGGLALGGPVDTVFAEHTILQPDLCYIVAERIAEVVGDRIEGAPDLVAEVLSEQSMGWDRGEKLRAYAEFGVRECWLVDPSACQIDVLVNRAGEFEVVRAVDETYRSGVISMLELNLVDFWKDIRARVPASARSEPGRQGQGEEGA